MTRVVMICLMLLLAGCKAPVVQPPHAEAMKQPEPAFEERYLDDEPFLYQCSPDATHLVVVFHTWADTYVQANGWYKPLQGLKKACLIAPNYNGKNDHPSACASDDALNRVATLIQAVRKEHPALSSVSLLGASGGGYMALMMLGTYPKLIDNASIWIPIYDLAAWYTEVGDLEPRHQHDLLGCFDRPPITDEDPTYRKRSPASRLDGVRAPKTIVINAGKYDGLKEYRGSVPTYHGEKAAQHIKRVCPKCDVTYNVFDGAHQFRVTEGVAQVNTMNGE